ncbi:hypothetical protein PGT21_031042 [Puccinia graminis f. sp. tritici]|uniref:Uncharacterized protein n=1 Tax=Puccinia graminis f. sp. tritici TaxID=56615 RepID=A0A5B0M8K4_PUCGR|nr:hypothetical protein PGT21_031042 [Puccinia graminis f. sp. tritici]KAA1086286.1 hypothetical protein PGTUg99_003479 [Puccinia graminis f. sp. tritici]
MSYCARLRLAGQLFHRLLSGVHSQEMSYAGRSAKRPVVGLILTDRRSYQLA